MSSVLKFKIIEDQVLNLDQTTKKFKKTSYFDTNFIYTIITRSKDPTCPED